MDAALYRSSLAAKPKLRIGVLLDGPVLPRWSASVLDHILQSDFAALELLVFNVSGKDASDAREVNRGSGIVFGLYQRWDSRNVDPATDPLATVDCSERLARVESIRAQPITDGAGQRIPDQVVQRIREKRLDVLLRFGFDLLKGEILTAATYGVWSYHHGDLDEYRGGPPYFWEVVERNAVSGAVLEVLADKSEASRVLYRGVFATNEGFSHARNRIQPYWGASTFVIQKLRELHAHGWTRVECNVVKPAPYRGKKTLYSKPSNREMLRWLLPLLVGKTFRRLIRQPMIRHWKIAVRVGAPPIPGSTSSPDISGFCWIESPKGRCYADPFVVEADGKHWVYFEDFDYATQRGKISCAELQGTTLGEPLTALERPYHVSYPCVFRDAGTWYMIPETVSAGTVELYRCTRFPDLWEFERELLKASAVDTTVWIEDGVYWFFVTFLEPLGNASQLWLYSAASLTGAWTPHPANPISTDVRYARGAGAVFRHEGKLYRPSQDDSGEYGRSITLNEIVVMDHDHYREEPRVVVNPIPQKGFVGTHTYGRAGAVEIIDGKMRLPAKRVL